MTSSGSAAGRRVVAGLAFATAVLAAAVQVVEGPPGSGYGWGSVVVSAVLVATPLVLLGLAVRSGDPRFAWPTLALAAVLLFFVLLALAGNWSGQSTTDRVLDSVAAVLVLATCLGAWAQEVPLLRRPAR